MTDETVQPEPKPAEAPKQTLEELYAEYEAPPAAPQAAPAQEPKPAQSDLAAIQREIAALRQAQEAAAAADQAKKDEVDLKKAVATLAQHADLKGKDKMLKGYLITAATEDKRLLNLWQKRDEQPDAWAKALEILSADAKREFEVPNPQLEENQRAMDESQRTHSSAAPPKLSREEDILRMPQQEFERAWARLAGRG